MNRVDREFKSIKKQVELNRIDGISDTDLDIIKKFYNFYSTKRSFRDFYNEFGESASKHLFYEVIKHEAGIETSKKLKEGFIFSPDFRNIFTLKTVKLGVFIPMVIMESNKTGVPISILFDELVRHICCIEKVLLKVNKRFKKVSFAYSGSDAVEYLSPLLFALSRVGINTILEREKATRDLIEKLKFLYGENTYANI